MAIKRNFKGTTIVKPGGFSVLDTSLLTQAPLGASGIVALVGTAEGGQPNEVIQLTGGQIQAAKATFKSGPIAEVLDLLVNPSNDPRVPSGASTILIYKTNQSTQSQKTLVNEEQTPINMLTLTSQNYGVDENNIGVLISEGVVADANAALNATPGAATYDMTVGNLVVTLNGAAVTFTPNAGDYVSPTAATPAEVRDSLNIDARWSATRPITATLNGDALILTVRVAAALEDKQLELGVLECSDSLQVELDLPIGPERGTKGSRVITVQKGDVVEVSPDLGLTDIMELQYTGAGTAAALSIQKVGADLVLTTTIAGGPGGEDLSIVLSSTLTVQQLVNQINSQATYTASTTFFNAGSILAQDVLDFYLNIDILNDAAKLFGVVKAVEAHINDNSELVTAALLDNIEGQLALISSEEFLLGAVRGGATNSNFQAGFDALRNHRANIVIPLVSEDGIGDDTFTVDSVNAQCDAHVGLMNSILGKNERLGKVTKDTDKDGIKAASQALNSQNVQLLTGKPTVLDSTTGTVRELPSYALACLVAGIQAGTPVGEPATHKGLRVINVTTDSSIDIKRDAEELILAAVAFAEQTESGGFRVAIDNTTYNKDSNSVFNRNHTYEASLFVSFELRTYLEGLFTGVRAATGTAEAIKNAAIFRLSQLRDENIIVDGNDDEGNVIPAFRDIQVSIEGGTAIVSGVVTPVPGIDFILQTVYLTELQASASA